MITAEDALPSQLVAIAVKSGKYERDIRKLAFLPSR